MRYNSDTWANEAREDAYREGADAVRNYIGCLHPETTLEDVLKSIQDAIETGVI